MGGIGVVGCEAGVEERGGINGRGDIGYELISRVGDAVDV